MKHPGWSESVFDQILVVIGQSGVRKGQGVIRSLRYALSRCAVIYFASLGLFSDNRRSF
jgi:hypothetical protein